MSSRSPWLAIAVAGFTALAGLGVTTTLATAAPPAASSGLFTTERPAVAADSDAAGVEVGLRFRSSANGFVDGVRFYKGPGNTGRHIGSLWTTDGTRLATAKFGTETASGWQSVTFATPVGIAAGTTYVASYFAPRGHYASTENYFATRRTAGTLTAPAGSNGVYNYGSASTYPTASWRSSNYWVDVNFRAGTPTSTPTTTARQPRPLLQRQRQPAHPADQDANHKPPTRPPRRQRQPRPRPSPPLRHHLLRRRQKGGRVQQIPDTRRLRATPASSRRLREKFKAILDMSLCTFRTGSTLARRLTTRRT